MSGLAKYFNSRLYVNVTVLHFEHFSQVLIKRKSRLALSSDIAVLSEFLKRWHSVDVAFKHKHTIFVLQ